MPRPVNRNDTIDLHAPWWSSAQDETGRYLERWVVRREMSEADMQATSEALRPVMRLGAGQNGKRQTQQVTEVEMNELPFARLYTLLQMSVEITDQHGTPQRINKDLIKSFATRDTEWVNERMGELYAAPIVEADEDDEAAAARNRLQGEHLDDDELKASTAESVAQERFRPSGAHARAR